MPKCYHPRQIDLPTVPLPETPPEGLRVQEEDGLPYVKNVTVIRFPNTSVTQNGVGDVSVTFSTGSGSGPGQAFFEAIEPAVGTVPGPTNLSGGALTITRVRIASDGEIAGTAAGQTFDFAAGGDTQDDTGLTTNWADGGSISATVDSVGADATYLTVDVLFEAAA